MMNPISGRSGTFDSSLIGSRNPFPRNMAHVMLRRLAARWNSDEITNRSWVSAVAGAVGAAGQTPRQRALGRFRRQAMLGCPAVDIL